MQLLYTLPCSLLHSSLQDHLTCLAVMFTGQQKFPQPFCLFLAQKMSKSSQLKQEYRLEGSVCWKQRKHVLRSVAAQRVTDCGKAGHGAQGRFCSAEWKLQKSLLSVDSKLPFSLLQVCLWGNTKLRESSSSSFFFLLVSVAYCWAPCHCFFGLTSNRAGCCLLYDSW